MTRTKVIKEKRCFAQQICIVFFVVSAHFRQRGQDDDESEVLCPKMMNQRCFAQIRIFLWSLRVALSAISVISSCR